MLSQRKQDLLKIWNKTIKNYPLLSLSLSLISDLLRFWTRISLQGCHYSKVVFFIYHLRKRQDWPFWVCMQAKTKTILWRTKQVSDFYYLRLIKGKQSHKEREKKYLIVHPKTSNYDVLAKLQFLYFWDLKRYDVKETERTSHVGMIWEWPLKSSSTSRVDFTNMFTCSFYAQRSQKTVK